MRSMLIVVYFLCLSGCALAGKTENFTLADKSISLNTKNCYVTMNDQITHIEMNGNCLFVKENNSDTIRTEYFEKLNAHVALIIGGNPTQDPDYPYTLTRTDCGNSLTAIIIKTDLIETSDKVFDNIITCAGIGTDEKEFVILSH